MTTPSDARASLLAAARRLFAAHGPAAVSSRAVAREAGVNYGLVHRHFGSKEALVQAVMDELVAELATVLGEARDPRTVIEAAASSPDLWRLLAYRCLDEGTTDATTSETSHPVFSAVREQLERVRDDGRADVRTALGFALVLGWVTLEPFLREAGDLDRFDDDLLLDELAAAAATVTGLG